jgi:hypothetical protein
MVARSTAPLDEFVDNQPASAHDLQHSPQQADRGHEKEQADNRYNLYPTIWLREEVSIYDDGDSTNQRTGEQDSEGPVHALPLSHVDFPLTSRRDAQTHPSEAVEPRADLVNCLVDTL